MVRTILVEAAQQDLTRLLDELPLGETVTLVGDEGAPQALLVSLKAAAEKPQSTADWDARWSALAKEISQAWKSDKSAVEILSEMRHPEYSIHT